MFFIQNQPCKTPIETISSKETTILTFLRLWDDFWIRNRVGIKCKLIFCPVYVPSPFIKFKIKMDTRVAWLMPEQIGPAAEYWQNCLTVSFQELILLLYFIECLFLLKCTTYNN